MEILKNLIKYFKFKHKKIYLKFFNAENVSMKSYIGKFVKIDGTVKINSYTSIGEYSHLNDGTKLLSGVIGRFCCLGYDCIIGPPEHPLNYKLAHPVIYSRLYEYIKHNNYADFEDKKGPIIQDNVWLGARTIV